MIGSALSRLALNKGDKVTAIVRPGSKRLDNLDERVNIVECELSGLNDLSLCGAFDAFLHLGWDKTTLSGRDDVDIQLENIKYTLDAVRLAKKLGCEVFIGAGSQAEYGITDKPISASSPVNPQSVYGIAKYAAGKMSYNLCRQLGIRHCWARILSIYGIYDADTTLIMYLIKNFLKGVDVDLTPCEQIWDYMFCDDAALALYSIMEKGKNGAVYCLGGGEGRKLKDYVLDIKEIVGGNSNINFGAREYYPHQPMYLVADISDLTADTGFVPKTPFKEGIKKTVEWLKEKNQ